MIELTSFELEVANYLKKYHKRDNPIRMKKIARIFNVNERDIREIIERIILSQTLVIGNSDGYWVATNKSEIKEANKINSSRLQTSLKKLVANKGDINWIYNYLNELKQKYETVPEGQLDIYEQIN